MNMDMFSPAGSSKFKKQGPQFFSAASTATAAQNRQSLFTGNSSVKRGGPPPQDMTENR